MNNNDEIFDSQSISSLKSEESFLNHSDNDVKENTID